MYKPRGSVVPAKLVPDFDWGAGIQVNSAENKPGFPRQPEADPSEAFGGCAGMTSRGKDHVEENPAIFMLCGRA